MADLTREQIENIKLHYFGREGDQAPDGLTLSDVRKLCDMALRSLPAGDELVAEIDALYERATKGPWTITESSNGGAILVRADSPDRKLRGPQTHLQIVPEVDANLIVALVNAWPKLRLRPALSDERVREIAEQACKPVAGIKGCGMENMGIVMTAINQALREAGGKP